MPESEKSSSSRQLTYLRELNPPVKAAILEYCNADIVRAPGHYDNPEPGATRRVLGGDVNRCQSFFVGEAYASVREDWEQSYHADQAWLRNVNASREPVVINGAVLKHVGKGIGARPNSG